MALKCYPLGKKRRREEGYFKLIVFELKLIVPKVRVGIGWSKEMKLEARNGFIRVPDSQYDAPGL